MTSQPTLPGLGHEAAQRLFDRLGQARANNGGNLSREEWLAITAGQFEAELSANCKKPRLKNGRNPVFDALASGCGLSLDQLTRSGSRAIAVAVADIVAVSPDVSPAEIAQRIAKYREKHPTWPLTGPAIAKNWASLGSGDPTRGAKQDVYQEPKEWRSAAIGIWGLDVGQLIFERGWANNGTDYRAQILAELADRQKSLTAGR